MLKVIKSSSEIIVLVITIFISSSAYTQNEQTIILRDNKTVDNILEAYDDIIKSRMKDQKIPALSIALVDKKGIVWSQSYGYIDAENSVPNTSETIFSIQSVSKTFTSTAVLIAVEKGLLDLNIPIQEYIPDFEIKSYHDSDPLSIITLKHLLSHTAGFVHEAPVGNNYTYDSPSFEDHIKSIQQTYLLYPVGQRYSYSNLGIDLAAYILQIVTQKPFDQFLSETLFIPLSMKCTSASSDFILSYKDRAPGNNRGRVEMRVIVPMQGAGGVYTCIEDFAKFMQFHLNQGKINGKELLSSSALDEMYTIPFPVDGQTSGYALGIDTYQKYNSLFLNHSGGGYGYLADMAWYDDMGVGVVVLTNSTNHNLQGKLYHEILDEIIKSQIKDIEMEDPQVKEAKIGKEKLKNYCGNYIGRFGSMRIHIMNNNLGIGEGDDFKPLTFYSENEAFLQREGYRDYFRFLLKKNQTPDYIVKLNGGNTWDYNDGPNDKPGPNSQQFDKYIGEYGVYIGGNPIAKAVIEKKNGYLYISYLNKSEKLSQIKPGVYANCNGELLIIGDKIIFASIFELVKI